MDERIKELSNKLNDSQQDLNTLDSYWDGTQPLSFLSPEAKTALGRRMDRLSVNLPRLAVTSIAERLEVTGFKVNGHNDAQLWGAWRRNKMLDASAQAMLDALIYGRSFVVVWADDRGRPQVTVDSPLNMAVSYHPVTREVTSAFKRWTDGGYARGVLYEADQITVLSGGRVVDSHYGDNWTVTERYPNPLGVVPVVPLVNRSRMKDLDGRSEMTDVLVLADMLNKVLADVLVTSEFYARPRRYVTGFEVQEDEDGNPIQPFSEGAGRLWISESPDTKFGEFSGAGLAGYPELVAMLTQQIGALSGLPPHYLGLNGDQPASADAIRSAEASLVSRAMELQRTFGQAWADVAALILAVLHGVEPDASLIQPTWSNPETRTPNQSADAATKLVGIGVPLQTVLTEVMGYTPETAAEATEQEAA